MPNQLNFPDALSTAPDQRPSRVSARDAALLTPVSGSETAIVFGQTNRDAVELYVYDDLNRIVAHTMLRPSDPALRLLTFAPDQSQVGVGQDNTPDNLQVDLVTVLGRLNLPAGRYGLTVNVFRDDVGQETFPDGTQGGRLYVADISPSRTELRLKTVRSSPELLEDVQDFVEPSVPPVVAQALVDQTFGTATSTQVSESITLSQIETAADAVSSGSFTSRLARANLTPAFISFVVASLPDIRNRVLDALAARAGDLQIRNDELQHTIVSGTRAALTELVRTQQLDPRIQLVDTDGQPVQ